MDSAAANAVLNRISNSVRAVTRLMTTNSANREVCLSKVDSCLAHISSIRGVLNDANIDAANVEQRRYTADRPYNINDIGPTGCITLLFGRSAA